MPVADRLGVVRRSAVLSVHRIAGVARERNRADHEHQRDNPFPSCFHVDYLSRERNYTYAISSLRRIMLLMTMMSQFNLNGSGDAVPRVLHYATLQLPATILLSRASSFCVLCRRESHD